MINIHKNDYIEPKIDKYKIVVYKETQKYIHELDNLLLDSCKIINQYDFNTISSKIIMLNKKYNEFLQTKQQWK